MKWKQKRKQQREKEGKVEVPRVLLEKKRVDLYPNSDSNLRFLPENYDDDEKLTMQISKWHRRSTCVQPNASE